MESTSPWQQPHFGQITENSFHNFFMPLSDCQTVNECPVVIDNNNKKSPLPRALNRGCPRVSYLFV